MHFSWWDTILSSLEMAGLFAVICAILHAKLLSKWPSVFAAVSLELVSDLTMTWYLSHPKGWWLQHPHAYPTYFAVYWGGSALQSMVRLWIFTDIVRSFEGLDFIPLWVNQLIFMVGASIAVTCAATCFYSNPHSLPQGSTGMKAFAVTLDLAVNIGCLAFIVGALVCARAFNFGWSPLGAYVTNGMILRVSSKAVLAQILEGNSRRNTLIATAFDSTCNFAVLFFWVWAFEKYRQLEISEEPRSSEELPFISYPAA